MKEEQEREGEGLRITHVDQNIYNRQILMKSIGKFFVLGLQLFSV